MLFVMLFLCSNYAKKICFLPYIMPNYSKFCLIMLCTRSACPSKQQARTSACIAESISGGIQTPSWYQCRPNSISEGEEKRRVSQAHAKIRSRLRSESKFVLIESYTHLDSCARPKICRPCHAHLKLCGGSLAWHRPPYPQTARLT